MSKYKNKKIVGNILSLIALILAVALMAGGLHYLINFNDKNDKFVSGINSFFNRLFNGSESDNSSNKEDKPNLPDDNDENEGDDFLGTRFTLYEYQRGVVTIGRFYYDEDQTMGEWVESEYNTLDCVLQDDNIIYNADNGYWTMYACSRYEVDGDWTRAEVPLSSSDIVPPYICAFYSEYDESQIDYSVFHYYEYQRGFVYCDQYLYVVGSTMSDWVNSEYNRLGAYVVDSIICVPATNGFWTLYSATKTDDDIVLDSVALRYDDIVPAVICASYTDTSHSGSGNTGSNGDSSDIGNTGSNGDNSDIGNTGSNGDNSDSGNVSIPCSCVYYSEVFHNYTFNNPVLSYSNGRLTWTLCPNDHVIKYRLFRDYEEILELGSTDTYYDTDVPGLYRVYACAGNVAGFEPFSSDSSNAVIIPVTELRCSYYQSQQSIVFVETLTYAKYQTMGEWVNSSYNTIGAVVATDGTIRIPVFEATEYQNEEYWQLSSYNPTTGSSSILYSYSSVPVSIIASYQR